MSQTFIFVCLAAVAAAQESELKAAADPQPAEKHQVTTKALALRVTGVRPGGVVTIDRGSRDGLALRDRVVFYPLKGKAQGGRVRVLDERSAEVQLPDPNASFETGTRGVVHIAIARASQEQPQLALQPGPVSGEHAPWEYADEEFEEGMPLLIQIDSVPPENRVPQLTGRLYSIGSARKTTDDRRQDSFFRLGTDMTYENMLGHGGQLFFSGELTRRDLNVNNQESEATTRERLDRLSYSWGGTRFSPQRHELGRFLHYGVPEFGILDGYEWDERGADGHSFGVAGGLLPEPTAKMSTGHDAGFSAYYRWTADKRERLTATGAYQKTFHNGDVDRDLIVGKLDYRPSEGWDFHATSWIDYYTAGDQGKGAGVELTRLIASTGKRWDAGDGLNFTFTHDSFPDIKRNEFLPVLQDQLDDDHNERLSTDGWTWIRTNRRLHGRFGIWLDQDDSGGDVEFGLEQFNVFTESGRADVRLFGVDGKFSTSYGVRLDYGIQLQASRWDLSYEYSMNDQVGFSSSNNDLVNHRLIGAYDYTSPSGWSLSLNGGVVSWTDEFALTAGFYLQRSF